ncbi:hypothetical protein Tco_0873197 [Tanacetum coccineum]
MRTSLTRFPALSVRSSNADALDSSYLLVLFIGHLKAGWLTNSITTIRMSPTAVLFDVDTGRISIRQCEMLKNITMNVLNYATNYSYLIRRKSKRKSPERSPGALSPQALRAQRRDLTPLKRQGSTG